MKFYTRDLKAARKLFDLYESSAWAAKLFLYLAFLLKYKTFASDHSKSTKCGIEEHAAIGFSSNLL